MTLARRHMLTGYLGVAVIAGAIACSEVGTAPGGVVSLEFPAVVSPSIVYGDTLRDTLGAVIPLRAIAFDASGRPIENAPIVYLSLDSISRVRFVAGPDILVSDTVNTGDTLRTRTARVQARVGSLQLQRTFTVVPRPDLLELTSDARPRVILRAADTSLTITARLRHVASARDTQPVPSFLVRFAIEHRPPGADSVVVFTEGRRGGGFDTTGADGVASRSLRIRRGLLPDAADSIVVIVSAIYRPDRPIAGSPRRVVIVLERSPAR